MLKPMALSAQLLQRPGIGSTVLAKPATLSCVTRAPTEALLVLLLPRAVLEVEQVEPAEVEQVEVALLLPVDRLAEEVLEVLEALEVPLEVPREPLAPLEVLEPRELLEVPLLEPRELRLPGLLLLPIASRLTFCAR